MLRTLYIRRSVLNGEALLEWARSQSINPRLAEDLHVTVCYSKTPVNWDDFKHEDSKRELRIFHGPRSLKKFGERGEVLVIAFNSPSLIHRHNSLREAGASHDFPEYHPHITIADTTADINKDILPYVGPIHLGPEIFEEINEDWKPKNA